MKTEFSLQNIFTSYCRITDRNSSVNFSFSKKILVVFIMLMAFSSQVRSQLIMDYHFTGLTYNATLLGYERPGVGIYYRQATGGTLSLGTVSCFGYSVSAPTSNNQFFFKAEKNINSFIVRGTGTGSNRTFTALATASTLNGTYVAATVAGTGTINGSTCGGITVTPASVITAGTFFRVTFSGNLNVTSIEFNFVPTGTPPTITTDAVNCDKTTTQVTGTVTPGTMPLNSSGIVWSTSSTPLDLTLSTKTVNTPAATTTFNNTATGLTPSTQYYYRAYVKDAVGNVYYGATLSCQTLAPTVPSLTTKAAFNIQSYKAMSGGTAIDSGGLSITQKGICWSTSPNPTIADSKTTEGGNAGSFNSLMRVLNPCVTYYVRAYAVNALGVGYGNQVQFQATCPGSPALIANPLSLNFGSIPFNASSTVFSYTLTGYNLTPASGNITVTPPAGYTVSLSPSSGFTSPLIIPYTGGALPTRNIYVKLATTSYGTFNGGIVHAATNVAPADADTVNLTGAVIPDPNVATNAGTDFWTGFGYQERMDRQAGDADETKLSLYISVPLGSSPAIVNVDLPGIPGASGFPKQNLTVNPGSVLEVTGFPTGDAADELNPNGLPDARLYYTGFSKRGIHIYSTNGVPVSVWMHTYAQNNSAAGAMLFPTNTWNNAYTVQAFGGQTTSVAPVGGFTNNNNPNSFFFVVANEDNTPIWFTPSQDIIDSSSSTLFSEGHTAGMVKYAKNIEHGPFILNKGQIFNAMGFIQGSGNSANGLDLSGSKVRTTCDKKIAVFGGNGRCLVNASTCGATQGSDHMIQQMFPSVAWGTRYLTAPTKTMEYNIFRINVSDPTTQVKVNSGAPLTGLINNQYYQVETNAPLLIESSKPVNVTQFIVAGQCNTSKGGKGDGDPEMIILSPVQQAINKATVYSATIKKSSPSANGHYINVIIHKDGRASFKLDGLSTADTGRSQVGASATTCYDAGGTISIMNAFQQHPQDPNYYYAKFKVTPGAAHNLESDSNFVAIAYGMGSGESYGYNAGTNIKDLTKPLYLDNPYLNNSTTNTSCTNNQVILKAVLPYPPAQVDSIIWNMGSVSNVTPQANVTFLSPTPESSLVIDGITYYVYKNTVPYSFSTAGSYNITGFVAGTFASQCGSQSPFNFNINIVDPGYADFNIAYNPCVDDTVRFTDISSGNGYPITGWRWDFGDGSAINTTQNPNHVYNPHSTYNITLRAINSIGCYADKTKTLDMTSELRAGFSVRDTICAGSSVLFTDTSSNAGLGGTIAAWFWDYGDGTKDTVYVSTNMTHIYATAGPYLVKLKVQTSGGCTATFQHPITVRPNPVANFDPPAGVCLPGATTFNNTTTISDGTISNVTYLWNFGDATTSTQTSPSHTYPNTAPPPGGYNVLLTATSQYGCVGTKNIALTTVYTKPTAVINGPSVACMNDSIQFNDASTGTGQTMTQWLWNFGDGNTSTVKNPKHAYAVSGTYTVTLTVTSDKGCVSDVSAPFSVKVNALPVAGFIMPSGCLSSGTVTFTDTTKVTPDDGTNSPFTYQWTIGSSAYSVQNPSHTFTAAGNYNIRQIVTTANGCKDTADLVFTIAGTRPNANFNIVTSPLCANEAVAIQNTTTIDIGTVTKIEIIWDNIGAPGTVETINSPTTSQVITHNYPDFHTLPAKTYEIKIIAYSGSTCFSNTSRTITLNPSPVTQFLAVPGICLGDSRTITQGSQTSSLPGTFAYSGSGIAAGGLFTSSVAGAGNHQLQYTYTTTPGCTSSSLSSITVWPAPAAAFNVSDPKCEKNNITITDISNPGAGTITTWTWNYGDASGTDVRNNGLPFTHQYNAANTYNITLQVTTSNGCNSTITPKSITVNPLPQVNFNLPAGICLPDGRGTFTDISTIADGTQGSFSYRWDFGDGGISLVKDPEHRYFSTGPFSVKLKITSNNGCVDSLSKTFSNIYPQPKASYVTTPAGAQVCLGDSIRFISTSNGMGSPVVKWRWTLGDGTTDTIANFWHTYTTAKSFDVTLHVFNENGCVSDTIKGQAIVDGYPSINAGPDVYILQGNSVTLNPTVNGSGINVQYLWTGPNLSNNNVKNPVATPSNDQQYILRVTNGLGCSAEDTMMVLLYRTPVFPNAFSPNGDGINDTWRVTYLSTYSSAKVEIFDRYGKIVFTSTGYNKPWDGTKNGNPLPVGVYYYVIHLGVLPQPLSGWITLLR